MTTLAANLRDRTAIAAWTREHGVYLALLVLVVFNAIATPNFLTVDTVQLLFSQVPPVIIVSLGMALVIGTGGVDLSVGSIMAIASAVLAKFVTGGSPIGVAMLAAVAAGLLVGVFNGLVVAIARVQPIVATLGVLVAGRGIALVITGGALVELFVPVFKDIRLGKFLGIPYVMIVAALLAVAVSFLVRRTAFGYRLLAVGGNRRASVLAGLPVRRTLVVVYAISGTLAAVAGVIATARLRASDPSYIGLLMELTAITAVVVGGTSLTGGRVRILGTVTGAILIQLLETTLVSHNAPDSVARMVEALIIIAAVYIQRPARSSR
ncbi:ABC transporter permease [Paractinoplanes globisporus]|uniref:ABC transporter permease n=1 Tax=Paractinoplanes globisporus TaxID=113565 RepID=A0ABW6WRP7_9ACTN|nr:ABC transporter permease [Actinoplanes globisporus]